MRIGAVSKAIVSWVACLALVMGALVPALAQAFAPSSAPAWMAICSTSGLTQVRADADPQAPDAPAHDLLKHCPSCASHTTDLALPPAAVVPPSLLPLSFERPARFWSAPRTLEIWRAAAARAPPSPV